MLIEIILALLLGITAGTFTGLFPGIHINLIAIFIVALSTSLFIGIEPLILITFLVAMAITHTFVDYIPSIFLGAPDEDNFLSILPGHNLLLKGHAYSAVVYTLYGSLSAIFLILLITPLFMLFLNKIYPNIQLIMPFILIFASIFLIWSEEKSKTWALMIFLLAGFLGVSTLNLPTPQPLLPLFTGLFGISSLITSIIKKQKIPTQKIPKLKSIKLSLPSYTKAITASIIASPLAAFLPGLGSSQSAIIGSQVIHPLNQKEFLTTLGAINTLVIGLSFITLYSINKTRTGTALAISHLSSQLTTTHLITILSTIIISGILAFFITIYLSKFFSKHISKINYTIISYSIILILILLTFWFSGFIGLIILTTSSALGLSCILLGIRRTHLMGSLLLPTILFYLV